MNLPIRKTLSVMLAAGLSIPAPCQVSAQEESLADQAQALYDLRNPYVGDASADGRLLLELKEQERLADLPYTMELETEESPYVLRVAFSQKPEEEQEKLTELEAKMQDAGLLLMALIDNLEEFQWSYPLPEDDSLITFYLSEEDISQCYSIEDIKEYGQSAEKLQELLETLPSSQPGDKSISIIGGADGPTSIFVAGKRRS